MASPDFRKVLETALECRVSTSRAVGVHPDVDDSYEIEVQGQKWHLAVEIKSSVGNAYERFRQHQNLLRSERPEAIPVLAVPRLNKRERAALKKAGVNHMDLAGNVWIRSPGLVVRTEGARPSVSSRPGKGRNPFSKKASLVARVLLEHPTVAWRVRDLAEEASLSVGYSSEILRSLVERGYAVEDSDGFRIEDPVGLLAEWVGSYRWEDNRTYSFVAPLSRDELLHGLQAAVHRAGSECLLTLLVALDRLVGGYVEHDQTHVYVPEVTPAMRDAVRSELYAEPVERGGNLHLMEPYYGSAVRYGATDEDGAATVSDVQLFLDLVHYPVRGPEAAAVLLRKSLGPRLGLSFEQMRALSEEVGL